jgi:N-hydroxyarylamine O-acetyltransferase
MDTNLYLNRIKFIDEIIINAETLSALHYHHLINIPFENLDIRYHKLFDLQISNIYTKVVHENRGGFCYELNALFCHLLSEIGFQSYLIASRIFDSDNNIGPEYDHMAVYVKTDKKYIVDVGFGDLFLKPLEINEGTQFDGRNYFIIEKISDQEYLLSMSSDKIHFQKKYTFNLSPVNIADFNAICLDKQTNPNSYFVKNTICTMPTSTGRVTIYNDKFIEKKGNEKNEKTIENENELLHALKSYFDLNISN